MSSQLPSLFGDDFFDPIPQKKSTKTSKATKKSIPASAVDESINQNAASKNDTFEAENKEDISLNPVVENIENNSNDVNTNDIIEPVVTFENHENDNELVSDNNLQNDNKSNEEKLQNKADISAVAIQSNNEEIKDLIHTAALQSDYFSFIEHTLPKFEEPKLENRNTSESQSGIHLEKPLFIIDEVIVKPIKKNIDLEDIPLDASYVNEDETTEQDYFDEANAELSLVSNTVEVNLPEWNLEEKYYSIGEVAKMFQVNTSHIRFWTTEFKMKLRTTRKGDRLYTKEDIEKLRLIHHLVKEKKYTIKGAKEKLKLGKGTVLSNIDLKDALLELREKLEQIKNKI